MIFFFPPKFPNFHHSQEMAKIVKKRKDGIKRTSSRSVSLHPQGSTVTGQEEAGEVDVNVNDKANVSFQQYMLLY